MHKAVCVVVAALTSPQELGEGVRCDVALMNRIIEAAGIKLE